MNCGITQAKLAGRETLCITGRDGLGREGRFQLFRVCDAQVELTDVVKGCFLYYHTESTYCYIILIPRKLLFDPKRERGTTI